MFLATASRVNNALLIVEEWLSCIPASYPAIMCVILMELLIKPTPKKEHFEFMSYGRLNMLQVDHSSPATNYQLWNCNKIARPALIMVHAQN